MYANIIIDISHESVDRVFQYRVPRELEGEIEAGKQVYIPFGAGSRQRKGYVVELTDEVQYEESKIKDVAGIVKGSVTAQSQLIWLAWWMKERYGSTMNQALKTVLPVKQKIKESPKRRIRCLLSPEALEEAVKEAERKKYKARLRLLTAFRGQGSIPYEEAMSRLGLTASSIKPLEEAGAISVEVAERYRNPLAGMQPLGEGIGTGAAIQLTAAQRMAADTMTGEYSRGIRGTYLIHGITGSGKTEVYMEFISHVVGAGKQVIVLIPEISLTWQTVMRFYRRFGNRVSVLNSRMSAGERYDQYERARTGDIDMIIGPRSALFAPFERLGLIIIDEEHENSYKSELSPRYDAREAAAMRAKISGASLVLGSATPSLESYTKALKGEYRLLTLKERAKAQASLPKAEVVDLREELKSGNRSIFSRRLKELIEDRLSKGEQTMLFINRRGYASFVSCRSCGEALKCPHCDVTLTLHRDGQMRCHYCGLYGAPAKAVPLLRITLYRPLWDRDTEDRGAGSENVPPGQSPSHGYGHYIKKRRAPGDPFLLWTGRGGYPDRNPDDRKGPRLSKGNSGECPGGRSLPLCLRLPLQRGNLCPPDPGCRQGRKRRPLRHHGDPDLPAGPLQHPYCGKAGLRSILQPGNGLPEDAGLSACHGTSHHTAPEPQGGRPGGGSGHALCKP